MFEAAGFEVVELETGDSALSYVLEQADTVGAVFSDVQMPGDTDGLDLAAYIATNWPAITIVLTSGHVHPTQDLPGQHQVRLETLDPGGGSGCTLGASTLAFGRSAVAGADRAPDRCGS